MPLFTTLAALSQTPASNPPDGSVDAPSSIDDQLRLLGSFIAQLRDGVGFSTNLLPSGTIIDYGGAAAPSGFLSCNGAAISRTTYAALFSAIGTTWGSGDGSTTFNLPDLRRRATIGVGGTALAGPANTLGAVGGEEMHSLSSSEMPVHNHTVNVSDPGHGHGVADPTHSHAGNFMRTDLGGGNFGGGPTPFGISSTPAASTGISVNAAATGISATTVTAGGGGSHNNMQPSAVVNKIIKI